ncbi:MAG: peptide chain release factor N(5)-glutamine methyltransferase [Oxalicibacterium faecigallinarum]|uniref:peptide chain release factor N(5)-glutamine methyltransferase n=1 Tax=Oxalicibacterium faecigallinarum TaxID=573741 RepID=UPI002806FCDF|nr:peptide chain release factor N(5)-glutamine methyltransferase [Oxalicibacterium faecigallinarum]MDQ7969663.1 peptide chain release factor N(5)-glutamine methyltransferase [Oxalicibacterium faecigallinarum]
MSMIPSGSTLDTVLRSACLPPLELRMLLGHILQLTRVQLITQSDRILNAQETQQLSALITRRMAGEPMAYLLGEREFFGLSFRVTPAVLIPRPETELLVELAIQRLPRNGSLLDMGTGSGAIAIAIAHARPDAKVTALDVSADALALARENAERNEVHIDFLQSDWFTVLHARQARPAFDLIVSNPPYIVAGDAHLSQGDLRFEPISALTDHADGLSALRTLCRHAASFLRSDGWLLMEHGYDQADAVRQLLMQNQFADVQSWRDLAGIERVSGGRLPADG